MLMVHFAIRFKVLRWIILKLIEGKGVGTWDVYTLNTNNIEDGSNGQVACDSYHLYERDVEMLKSLGVIFF